MRRASARMWATPLGRGARASNLGAPASPESIVWRPPDSETVGHVSTRQTTDHDHDGEMAFPRGPSRGAQIYPDRRSVRARVAVRLGFRDLAADRARDLGGGVQIGRASCRERV